MPLDRKNAFRAAALLCAVLRCAPLSAQTKTAIEVPALPATSGLGQIGSAPMGALTAPAVGDARRYGLAKPAPKHDPAQESLIKNHEAMVRGRDFGSYVRAFDGSFGTGDFSRSIAALSGKPGARWLDSGGGEGLATAQLMAHPGYEGLETTVVSYETSARPGPRRKVLEGRFLQDIPQESLGKNDLITDVIGVLAYTYDFMSDFRKLYDALTPNGELYVFMASSVRDFYGRDNKVIVDGRVMTLADFLVTIPGLDIKLVKTPLYDKNGRDLMGEVWNVRVKRTPGAEPKWPQLETIYFREGNREQGEMVPQRVFMVKGTRLPSYGALDRLSAEERFDYARRTESHGAETFFDKFRGRSGMNNPLMNRLARLGKGQTWALDGPSAARVSAELRDGVRFTGTAFLRPAQWLMERMAKLVARKTLRIGTYDEKPRVLVVDDGHTSYRFAEDLARWVESVPDGGEIWLSLGLEEGGTGTGIRIMTLNGRRIDVRRWLETVLGLDVTSYRGHRLVGNNHEEPVFVRIVVPDHAKVHIQKLELLAVGRESDEGVRIPLYRETRTR
ncbi:MAG: hypothetical protein A2506_09475 [Elusimicrobia bacterium RIFOXYD12_FULL_66_9]|nr:MAG: hypothetical protein A2506_09475 [Elusimicrobia bacterium RIFOXYD12_FULL_66_9]